MAGIILIKICQALIFVRIPSETSSMKGELNDDDDYNNNSNNNDMKSNNIFVLLMMMIDVLMVIMILIEVMIKIFY